MRFPVPAFRRHPFPFQGLVTMRKLTFTLYYLLLVPFLILVAATNILHPLFHMWEGGSVDAALDYVTALAAQIANERRI